MAESHLTGRGLLAIRRSDGAGSIGLYLSDICFPTWSDLRLYGAGLSIRVVYSSLHRHGSLTSGYRRIGLGHLYYHTPI